MKIAHDSILRCWGILRRRSMSIGFRKGKESVYVTESLLSLSLVLPVLYVFTCVIFVHSLSVCVTRVGKISASFGKLWDWASLSFERFTRPRTFMRLCWMESITSVYEHSTFSFYGRSPSFFAFYCSQTENFASFWAELKVLSLKRSIKLYYIIFEVLSEPKRMLINDCVLVFVIAIKLLCLIPFFHHLPAANSSLWLLLNDNRFPFLSSFPRYSQFYLLFKSFVCLASLLICFCWGFIISCFYCLHVRSFLNFIVFGLAHRTKFFSAFSHSRRRHFSSCLDVRRCRMKKGKRFFLLTRKNLEA